MTGSGKTEVYLSAIEQVVAKGSEAIVLVPEISLTPQTIRRFRRRFSGGRAAQPSERRRAASALAVHCGGGGGSGRRRPLAIFAPTRQLGLIVMDEEHESTFKQETVPRYHARDVAVKRRQRACRCSWVRRRRRWKPGETRRWESTRLVLPIGSRAGRCRLST